MIRDALPSSISRKDEASITIVKYPRDIPCIYSEVRSIYSELWNGKRSVYYPDCGEGETIHVDVMLHIGMRPSKDHCCLETFARREGYEQSGEDGKHLDPGLTEKGGYWEDLPETLKPAFDIDEIARRLAKELPVSRVFDPRNTTRHAQTF